MLIGHATSQTPLEKKIKAKPRFVKEFEPHKIVGNLFYVGGYDLASFLLTSDEGHILINTGMVGYEDQLISNISELGFRVSDIEILLVTQAHYDHVGSLATLQRISGAHVYATKHDAPILESGGLTDPYFGPARRCLFERVTVKREVVHNGIIRLGSIALSVHEHPGHTRGSASYSITIWDDDESYEVAIINLPIVNNSDPICGVDGKKLIFNSTYPGIADDFFMTFKRLKKMSPDIWVAAHAKHYGLHEKYSTGSPYSAQTFLDPEGFHIAIKAREKVFMTRLLHQIAAKASPLLTEK